MLANKLLAAQVPSAASELFSLVAVAYDSFAPTHVVNLGSFTVSYPPGIEAGDLALLFWSDDYGGVRAVTPSGFTLISADSAGTTQTITGACYYKVCNGLEDGGLITVNYSTARFYGVGAILLIFRPASGNTFGEVVGATPLQNLPWVANCPDISGLASSDSYLIVRFAGYDDPTENSANPGASPEDGYLLAGSKVATSSSTTSSVNIAAAYSATARSGITSTGISTIFFNQNGDLSIGMTVAVRII